MASCSCRGGGNVALSVIRLESSIAHLCCFRASCPCVRVQNSQCRYLSSALTLCLLPHIQYQMPLWHTHSGYCFGETVCLAAPAAVRGGTVYSPVNLMTLHVWKGVWVSTLHLLQVQNTRAAELKVKMGFPNMVISPSVFPTLFSSPLLSVCFSSWCVCFAPYSLENVPTDTRLGFKESFLHHGVVQVLWVVL